MIQVLNPSSFFFINLALSRVLRMFFFCCLYGVTR